MVLLGIRKNWVETIEARVRQRIGYPVHWSDPTKAYTHTLPIIILLPLPALPNADVMTPI